MVNYIEEYLPFLDKSPFMKERTETVETKDFFLPFNFKENINDIFSVGEEGKKFLADQNLVVYKVEPLGIYILEEPLNLVRWYQENFETMVCQVHYIDYNKVARFIELREAEKGVLRAVYLEGNGELEYSVKTFKFIETAMQNKRYIEDDIDLEEGIFESVNLTKDKVQSLMERANSINEVIDFDEWGGTPEVETDPYENPISLRIKTYLMSSDVTERIPVLVGPTAVAKSAMIQDVASTLERNGYGFRVLDLRVAFMTRLDMLGLTETKDDPDGNKVSYNALMAELVECTDAFINYARSSVGVLEDRIAEIEQGDEGAEPGVLGELKKMLVNFKEKSKNPVLFLDEMTRAERTIQDAFTKILNEKEFHNYPMTISRIVGATNIPLGIPEEDKRDLRTLYVTSNLNDIASADRIEPLEVYPSAVYERWKEWGKREDAEGVPNLDPIITQFIEADEDRAYNFDVVLEKFRREERENNNYDTDILFTTPFPNYRTWHMVSDYVRRIQERGRPALDTTITGLIGEKFGEAFLKYLQETTDIEVKRSSPDDVMDNIVEDGLVNNHPVMLLGPSSIGKTYRVKKYAEEMGIPKDDVIDVNLAQADRVDVMGGPAKVPISSYIGGIGSDNPDAPIHSDPAMAKLNGMIGEFNLPEQTTVRAPRDFMQEKVRNATPDNPIVLFFDEVNRVQNPAMSTAVFEAISDNRLFGVEFDPESVRIVCAGNIGSDYSVKRLDPAFAARCAIHYQTEYTEGDAKGFIEHIKENNFNEYLIDYLENKSIDEVLEMISKIEQRTLENAQPSMRAISDLNRALEDSENNKLLKGTLTISSPDAINKYQETVFPLDSPEVRDLEALYKLYKEKAANWSGLDSEMTFQYPKGGEKTPEDILNAFLTLGQGFFEPKEGQEVAEEDSDEAVKIMKGMLTQLYSVETNIADLRRDMFKPIIGTEEADDFTSYYNSVSGTEAVVIEIPCLRDKGLMPLFFDRLITGIDDPTEMTTAISGAIEEFWGYFTDTLSIEHYRTILTTSMDCLATPESRSYLIQALIKSAPGDNVIRSAESGDPEFVKKLLGKADHPVDDEALQKIAQGKEGEAPKKSKFL